MKNIFTKLLLTILAIGLLWLPSGRALAAENPPTWSGQATKMIEKAFANQQKVYERHEKAIERAPQREKKAQRLLERAAEKGMDTSAARAALEGVRQAFATAAPLHEQAGKLIQTHPGFDANGKVTDAVVAAQTVEDLRKLQSQAHDTVSDARKKLELALWDLLQAGISK